MNSMSEREAPSPIGYFWYRGTLIGGTRENLAESNGSRRQESGSVG